jgi:hypothetical protein
VGSGARYWKYQEETDHRTWIVNEAVPAGHMASNHQFSPDNGPDLIRRIEPVKEAYDGLEINCEIKLVILLLRLNLGYV